jgi:ribosomal-protein-alanine N-acetyltransferase
MAYAVRAMVREDLEQVTSIDREVFPTQWPPANYRREMDNKLAHYIIVHDTTRSLEDSPPLPRENHPFLSRLLPWLRRDDGAGAESALFRNQYIVGFSGIWMMAGEAHVTNIAVRQEYQRRGIGALLLIATADLAREHQAETMTLEVRESNHIARNLYRKYGYYLDNRENAIIMSTENINSAPFQAQLQRLRESLTLRLPV